MIRLVLMTLGLALSMGGFVTAAETTADKH